MPGYYNKAAPDAPKVVQIVDRLVAHRYKAILVAAGILGTLIGLSIFMPKLGLPLLAVAVVALLGVYVLARAQSQYRTHWTREVHRR